jgi:hypothetical protein
MFELVHRSGARDNWTDTHGLDRNIPMWKDDDLILDYPNFWSQRHLFPDYVVPAVPASSIAEYQKGLDSCTDRIEGCRTRPRADAIIKTISVSIVNFFTSIELGEILQTT